LGNVKPSNVSGQGNAGHSEISSVNKKKGVVMPSTEREEPNIVLSLGGGKESKKLL
jgi:hypothetical protein